VQTTDKGGVSRYIEQLVPALAAVGAEHGFRLLVNFCRSRHRPAFDDARRRLRGPNREVVRGAVPAALWLRGLVPAELCVGRVDVFHGLYDFVPPVITGASVLTIHDLRYVTLDGDLDPSVMSLVKCSPELMRDFQQRADFFARQRATIGKVASRAAIIITPSEYSRRSIVELLGVPEDRVLVVPHGVTGSLREPADPARLAEVRSRLGVRKPYLLFVSKLDPLKNIDILLSVFARVREQLDVQLVLAGPAGWYLPVLERRAAELSVSDDVHFLGHVSDEALHALYWGAEAMVFPSLFEGFGLPVLEAMACGTPVVCSDHCSLPEVAGDAAMLVDPTDVDALAAGVLRVVSDDALKARMSEAGLQRSRQFTWTKAAEQTLAAYRLAAER
jgi:glycosyltransferase involved in cell wall biosynthesis